MAPKPKKATTNEKTRKLINRAYDLRTIQKVNATPAEKRQRARQVIDTGKTAARAIAISNREDKKKAAAKAAKAKKLSPIPSERRPKAGSSTVSKVVKRAKTVAREVRDIPTAVSTAVSGRNVGYGGGKFAAKDLKTQIKEVGSAIKSGKKGTEAAQVRFGSRKKGTVGAGSLDQNVSKKKAPRK